MATITRPDGTVIYYEVSGEGFPLLLIAPGGVSSQIDFWRRMPMNPIDEYSQDFQVIAMDQRHAGKSFAPAAPFSYEQATGDQLAVLDAVGAQRAHVMGGCIGCAHIWALVQAAPQRFAAIVAQNPVGLDETNTVGTFYRMFDDTMRVARADGMAAVIVEAMREPVFAVNNAAGPFGPRIAADEAFREEIGKMRVEAYVALIVRFRDGVWPENPPFFTASEAWMRTCPQPIIVLPGSDPFHPTGVGRRICELAPDATCLEPGFFAPENLAGTVERVRAFLKTNTPG